jgi:hypothetical protein
MPELKNRDEAEQFKKMRLQLNGLLSDFAELSKKKPNDAVGKFKLGLVNTVLESANGFLDKSERPFPDFEIFGEDQLPSNSDVALILSQYRVFANKFVKENSEHNDDLGQACWVIRGKVSDAPV